MLSLTTTFAITLALIMALATLVIWSRKSWLAKLAAFLLALGITPAAYAAYADLLGRPKPVSLEWFKANASNGEVEVLGAFPIPEVAIHLYVKFPDEVSPRAYVLPWSTKAAEQLQEAGRQAAKSGTGVRMKGSLLFEPTLDPDEPMFWATPVEALPPKMGTEDGGESVTEVIPYGEDA